MPLDEIHIYGLLGSTCALLLMHKLRRIHAKQFEMASEQVQQQQNLYRQFEALQGLYAELDMAQSLPPMRDWAASPDFLLLLARHVRTERVQHVVECSSGVSTLVLARCLQLNGQGKVYSLEHDADYASHTQRELARCGLLDWAEVIHAPLQSYYLSDQSWPWYSLKHFPRTLHPELLVIDGPPQATRKLARYPAGPLLFPLLAERATVFLDDAARQDEQTILQRWQQEHPGFALTRPRCEKGCAVLRTI